MEETTAEMKDVWQVEGRQAKGRPSRKMSKERMPAEAGEGSDIWSWVEEGGVKVYALTEGGGSPE